MIRVVRKWLGFAPGQSASSLSKKEKLVIDLLGEGEKFGEDLVKASGGKLRRGTLYVLLARMGDQGLIAHRMIRQVHTHSHEWMGKMHEHEHVNERRLYRRGVPRATILKPSEKARRDKARLLLGGS